jgi:quercetin dioxygenase-like cupin family protein
MVKKYAMAMSAVSFVAMGAAALATPGSHVLSSEVMARGTFADPVDLKIKVGSEPVQVILAPDAKQTVMQRVVLGPEGHTGWHSHPGPVVVLVKAGSLALYSSDDPACIPRVYTAGQSFIDSGQGHVHIGANPSSTDNTDLWVTYFDVPAGQPFRIDAADPGNCD